MTITAVQSQTVVEIGPASDRELKREYKEPVRPQCCCCCCYDVFQVAEIHESVARHDQVECSPVVAEVIRQLGFQQFVVDVLLFRVRQHSCGEINTHQSARIRSNQRT